MVTLEAIGTSSNNSVNVPDDPAELLTRMFVTTVVVDDGTVYKVVLDVAAAVRASAFAVVAISMPPLYSLFLRLYHLILIRLMHLLHLILYHYYSATRLGWMSERLYPLHKMLD